jgi:hypothetical protein
MEFQEENGGLRTVRRCVAPLKLPCLLSCLPFVTARVRIKIYYILEIYQLLSLVSTPLFFACLFL